MKILCVGQLVADIIAAGVDYENLGSDTELVDDISIQNGGDCMNTAISLSRLGCEVVLCGKVGADLLGDFLTQKLCANGIDTRGLSVDHEVSTSSVVALVNHEGQRVFLYNGGSNEKLTADDVDPGLLTECGHLHIGGTYLLPGLDGAGAARLLKNAQMQGKTTSMDVTWDTSGRWFSVIEPCLPFLNLFMPSESEASKITNHTSPEEMAKFLLANGVETAIIKLGEKGAYIENAAGGFCQPAYSVPVVDTTGAGDAFVAGFLSRYTAGADLRECARIATGAAAHCIGAIGATTGVPDIVTVEQFILEKEEGKK